MQKRNLRPGRLLWFGCAVILIGVPFHALLTAWFASRFGYFDEIRLWKEALLFVLVLSSLYLVIRHPALRRDLQHSRLAQALVTFIGFTVLMAAAGLLWGTVSWRAALYGVIIDTRSFVFLLVLLVAGHLAPLPFTRRRWILFPALVVIAIGVLQLLVFPPDFLRHFGYGPDTLQAYQPVDNKPGLARLQSTLRGPNPLGAYLIPVIMSFVAMTVVSKKRRLIALLSIAAGLVVLFGSYSRSAAAGLVIAVWLFTLWTIKSYQIKKVFLGISAGMLVLLGCLGYGLRQNDTFQNIVFHTNEKSTSATSSNNARLAALKSGLKDIVHHPAGRGVGTAGPASVHNSKGGARISENYFLQIGQEAGVIGLLLFLLVIGGVVRILYHKRSDTLTRATLASFIGILLVNMTTHAFADDTLAYTLFALLGYAFIRTRTHPTVAEQVKPKPRNRRLETV